MTAYYPPVKNSAFGYTFLQSLLPTVPTGAYLTSPTLAAGDVMVSKDGGAFVSITTLPMESPAGSGVLLVTLSQSELNADNVVVRFKDVSGAQWNEERVYIQTIANSSSLASVTGTDVSVCNMSLDLLKEAPIDSFSDDTPEANWFVRNYAVARDAELEEHPWKFALKRDTLTVDATAPEFDWPYRYEIPSDCLRVLPLRYDGKFEGRHIPHEIEDGYILTNQSSELKVIYIYRNTDVSTWPALFKQALAARMATMLAHWLTGKASMIQIATNAYERAVDKAKKTNAIQSTVERPLDDDVLDQRYDAEGVR